MTTVAATALILVSLVNAVPSGADEFSLSDIPAACVPAEPIESDEGAVTEGVTCPETVSKLHARAGNLSVEVSWSLPVNSDVVPLSELFVIVNDGERVLRAEPDATSITIDGLRNGVEYSFAVVPVSEDGAGPASEVVNATPTAGQEGVVAGIIVEFATDVNVDPAQNDVPGEQNVESVDLTIAEQVTDSTVLVDLSEPVSVDQAQRIAAELEADPAVKWAEPDVLMFTAVDGDTVPDDTQYVDAQWNLWGKYGIGLSEKAAGVAQGWADGTGDGARVAVIDTGITSTPELDGQLVNGYDFVSNPENLAGSRDANAPPQDQANPFDGDYVDTSRYGALGRDADPSDPGDWNQEHTSSWHGTKLAGLIAAIPNNASGIVGVAPGAKVQPIRALSWRGGLLSDVSASIIWAAGGSVDGAPVNSTPSDVINLSFTAQTSCPQTLQDAINSARERGAVVVAAAGNNSSDAANYAPGNCSGVITVAATSRAGELAGFSNYGERIDIAAPGVNITSTSNTGATTPVEPTTSVDDGTSLAAAEVSAAAAILAAANPDRGPKYIENQLTNRAQAPPLDACAAGCGAGILSLVEIASVASGDQDFSMTFTRGTTNAQATSTTLGNELSGAFTIEAWVKPTTCSVGDQTIIEKSNQFVIACRQTSGTWQFILGNAGGTGWNSWVDTLIAPTLNSWQHIALTRSSGSAAIEFYVNGQLANSSAAQNTLASTSSRIIVGDRASGSNGYTGGLDELRLYSTYRASSISTDMSTYGPTNTSGLVAYYDFNEGPAGTAGSGTVVNRASSATSSTNLSTVGSPTYVGISQISSSGSNTVVTFPRSYLTAAGGWRAPVGVATAKAIILGGGGGGAGRHGGGGGAGGLVDRYTSGSVTVSEGSVYPITVGQGGRGAIGSDNSSSSYDTSQSGQASTAFGLTADGGGKGVVQGSGVNGGSGGGKYTDSGSGGQPTGNGTGFAGGIGATNSSSYWAAGGGGGAGGAGGNATASAGGAAGAGLALSITGASVMYARGGAGGYNGATLSGAGENGTANLGDGGGGAGSNTASVGGGQGGSGVVIVSYASSASGTCAPAQTQYTTGAATYRVVAFKDTGTCSWSVPAGVTNVDYLVVAGGGGGASRASGGGGAGGLLQGTTNLSAVSSLSVVVGQGGAGAPVATQQAGVQGGLSRFSGTGVTTVEATGGGAGGSGNGGSGGSGGGAGGGSTGGTGTSGQGNNGAAGGVASCTGSTSKWCGGGGGGAGGAATAGGASGAGVGGAGAAVSWSPSLPASAASILGVGAVSATNVLFAGGGGGGADIGGTGGGGGSGGGGAGGIGPTGAVSGAASTGGGGGGGGYQAAVGSYTDKSGGGGSGGSGVVMLRFVIATDASTCTTSSAVDGSNTVVSITGGTACTWQVPAGVASLDVLVVGGGGGGSADGGGGGGGGGVRSDTSVVVSGGTTATITVGTGGVGGVYGGTAAGTGTASTVSWSGKSYTANGGTGGSGWTSTNNATAGTTSGNGSSGTSGTGGAGPGSCTTNVINQGTNGGNGTSSSITGTPVQYAGGGGGGSASNTIPMTFRGGAGDLATGSYGGGKGAAVAYGTVASVAGYYFTNGTAGTLGGGGGAGAACGSSTYDSPTLGTRTSGGAGGNGIVVFRYATPTPVSNVCSPVSYTYSTNTVLEFQGSGSCNWTVPSGVSKVNALLVAGGGGGGSRIGGGGGAGELASLTNQSVTAGSTQTIVVGAGGAGGVVTSGVGSVGTDGSDSSAFGTSVNGGGGGGYVGNGSASASAGGSGGGASCSGSAGSSSKTGSGSGNAGGAGSSTGGAGCVAGGGGGAGGAGSAYSGQAGGAGGAGLASSITGTSVMYAGGGGGGINDGTNDLSSGEPGLGGSGGGGAAGAKTVNPDGRPGTDGLGAGGGGGSNGLGVSANSPYAVGGDGGDGVVIVSYSNVPEAPTSVTGTANAVTTMDVAWTAPTYTGGSDITGYSVVVSDNGAAYAAVATGTCTSSSSSTSTTCTATGLTAGHNYTFKVTAISANGSGAQSAASSSATAYGDLDHFAVTTTGGGALSTQTAGSSFNVMITAQDSANTTVGNFTGTVVVTSTSLFSAGSGTTSAFTAGVLSSHAITLIRAGSSQTVTATRSSGGSQAGTSAAFTINAGTATKLQTLLPGETAAPGTGTGKTGSPTAVTAGASVTATVNAVDANWNVVSSATPTVAITSSDGAATLPSNAALVSGTKNFSVTLKTAGSQTITATDQAGSPLTASTSAGVTVNPGVASVATSTVDSTPTSITANGSSTSAITVTLKDAYSNLLTAAGGTVVVATNSGSVGSTTNNNNGTYSATLTSSTSAVTATVSATLDGNAITDNASVTFTAGAATKLVVTGSSSQTAGGSQTITVTAQDANGNTVTTYTGAKSLTFSGANSSSSPVTAPTVAGTAFGSTTSLTFTNGVATGAMVLYAAETATVSVTDGTLSSSGAGRLSTTVSAASANKLAIATQPVAGASGAALSPQPIVRILDQYGNLTGSTATVSVSASAGTLGGSQASSGLAAVAGVATFTNLTFAGSTSSSATLTFSSGVLISVTSATITPSAPGTATQVVLTTNAAGIAAGSAFTTQPRVEVRDASGNTVTTDNSSAITASISAGGALVGTASGTVTNGVFTFTDLGAYGVNGTTYTLTFASGSLTSATQNIAMVTGPAATVLITTQPAGGVYAVALTTQPVVRLVDAGGNIVSSSGTMVTASIASGSGSLAGSSVLTNGSGIATFTGLTVIGVPGSFTVTFSAPGLTPVTSASFNVTKANQAALTMTSPANVTYGQTPTLSATGGSGTGAVSYSVVNGTCAVVGTTLMPGDAGSLCEVRATKATDTYYFDASSPTQTITIARAGQVISFTSSVPTTPLPGGTYTPTASAVSSVTGTASSVTPTLNVTAGSSSVCSMTSGVVTFAIAGSCVVEAAAGQNTNYDAATSVQQTIVVGQNNQTITFAQPGNVMFGDASFALAATASSNLTVTYSLGAGTTNAACSVSTLGVVTVLHVGTCEVVAAQAGSGAFAAASDVPRAFQVLPAVATAPTISSASASDQSITVAFSSPGFTGGASITAYQVVATPVGIGTPVATNACSPSASPLACTISGLTNGTTYTVTVAAINAAGTGPTSIATGQLTPATAANAVTSLVAVPGDTVLNVSWTSLLNPQLGGGTFTRYVVSYRVAGSGSWTQFTNALTNQNDHGTTITGLTNSVSYDVQVVAITTANATAIPGNTATVVEYPSTTPSAPQDVSVLASTATTVQVSWQPPLTDGGTPLTSPYYSVSVSSTSPGATSPVGCNFAAMSDRFCSVAGLTNGAVYTVNVTAQNRMGVGAAGTATYSVPSDDSSLSNLVVNAGSNAVTLSPTFLSGTLTYTASVENDVESVTVTPTTTTGGASATVNGVVVTSGSASSPIALAVGANSIAVVVTASDPNFTSTYAVTVTRAQAPTPDPGPAPAPDPTPSPNTGPETPPKPVSDGSELAAVKEDGKIVGTTLLVNEERGKAKITGSDFTFVIRTFATDGSVSKTPSNTYLLVPQGGVLTITGTGYAANTLVAIYAIPNTRAKSTTLLGTVTSDGAGVIDDDVRVPQTFSTGDYILQTNGVTASGSVRSVNASLKVKAETFMIQRAAFYQPRSFDFSANGKKKVTAILHKIPSWATDVNVTVVGVAVSLASGWENVKLAWKRGRIVAHALQREGIRGKYTISTYTSYTRITEQKELRRNLRPQRTPDGKPLTTVNVTYTSG